MGAEVKAFARVRSGAVVRMGAVVGKNAVVERDAVVSWGAVVRKGSVVGEGAVVGAGATLGAGSRLPPGMSLRPGVTWSGGDDLQAAPAAAPLPAANPAEARLAAVCEKLDSELRASPEGARALLEGSGETVASLRRRCEDLSRRERLLRREADPAALVRLEEERKALQARIASERDERIRASLDGAVAAIAEQKRQRDLVLVGADRLQAEHTRLLYILEGLASQLLRMRAAGAEAGRAPDGALERSAAQLRGEIEAIADALEQVGAEGPATGAAAPGTRAKARV